MSVITTGKYDTTLGLSDMMFGRNSGLFSNDVQDHIRLFELLVKHSSDVIWLMDTNMRTLFMSPSIKNHLGYEVEEYLALAHEKRLPEASFRQMNTIVEQQVLPVVNGLRPEPETPICFELLHCHKDGRLIWGEITLSFLHTDGGKIKWVMGITRDIDARKRTQDELAQSREHLHNIINESSDWIWEIDAEDRFTFSNHAVEDILGLEPKDIMGKRPYDFAYEKTVAHQLAHYLNMKQAKLPLINFKVAMQHIQGSIKYLDVKAVPFYDKEEALMGYRGICRDITSGKAKSRTIELLERTHASLLTNEDFAWIKLDQNFEILEWNNGATRIFGFSRAETQVHAILTDMFPPAQLRKLKKHFLSTGNDSSDIKYAGEALHKNGARLHCLFALFPVFDAENNSEGGDLFIHDYTKCKHLLDLSVIYDEVFSAYSDAYIITDKFFNITVVNENSARWLGSSPGDLIGKNIAILQCEESMKRIHDNGKHVARKKQLWQTEVTLNTKAVSPKCTLRLFAPASSTCKSGDFVFVYAGMSS